MKTWFIVCCFLPRLVLVSPECSDCGRLLWPWEGGVLGGRLLPHGAVDGSGPEAAGWGRDVQLRGCRHHTGLPELLCLPAGGPGEIAGLHKEAAGAWSVTLSTQEREKSCQYESWVKSWKKSAQKPHEVFLSSFYDSHVIALVDDRTSVPSALRFDPSYNSSC